VILIKGVCADWAGLRPALPLKIRPFPRSKMEHRTWTPVYQSKNESENQAMVLVGGRKGEK
jgi:hypothetical protein